MKGNNLICEELFGSGMFQDCWLDAQMDEVIRYLRGARSLRLPDRLRLSFLQRFLQTFERTAGASGSCGLLNFGLSSV